MFRLELITKAVHDCPHASGGGCLGARAAFAAVSIIETSNRSIQKQKRII